MCIYRVRYSYINFEKPKKQHALNGILPWRLRIRETGRFMCAFFMSFSTFQVSNFNVKNYGENCNF